MTSNSNDLLARVREFVAQGGEVDERVDSLILRGPLPDAATQAAWLHLATAPQATGLPIQLYNAAVGDDLVAGDMFDPTREIVITISKPQVEDIVCFFFEDRLANYLGGFVIASELRVSDLNAQNGFTARRLRVEPWDIAAVLTPKPSAARIDPTPFVRDFVPTHEIAADVSPWILLSSPAVPSAAFARWKSVASRRLLGSLVSSAWLEGDVVWLQASGPPLYRLRADSTDIVDAFVQLTDAVNWVFLSGQDVEARHIIFASELARADRPDQTFLETMARALDSAGATYEAHVQSSSRDTLKALGELRRTVINETQEVTQKTQNMTVGLWRDLAVTATPFVLTILGEADKAPDPAISAGFYFAAAIFIAVSFALQWRLNSSFFAGQMASRASWMRTLYNYVSAREREEIADAPIEGALRTYRQIRRVLLIIYILLFALLTAFGVATLREVPTSALKQPVAPITHPVELKAANPPPNPASAPK